MRVIVADDFALFRQGLAQLLGADGIEVVGEAGDAEVLLALVREQQPDAVVVDVRMPPTQTAEGLRAAVRIKAEWPAVGVLVLSHYAEPYYVEELLRNGRAGVGYLLKDRVRDAAELADAVRRVAGGGSVVDPEVVAALLRRWPAGGSLDQLSDREREVLGLMAEGRSNQAIADRLGIGGRTTETHVRSIFQKLSLLPAPDDDRRVLAVLHYLRGATD